MNELGELLKELRGKQSLRDIAEKTGLSHTYIRDVENGVRRASNTPIKPSPTALKKFSQVYDYPYEELMKKAGYLEEDFDTETLEERMVRDPKLRMIFRAAETLTEKEKDLLRNLMEQVFPDAFKNL
ncbi:helix-turn-helix domain-containing protein [Laceyella tengchongensis]|jgi:transcriptional regulator with XRE-family HTH domain